MSAPGTRPAPGPKPDPPAYDAIRDAANRVLDLFAEGFEKFWLRRDEATREKYLAVAIERSDAFSEKDAERIRKLTRDPVPICHLLDVIGESWDVVVEDPGTLRRYRNQLNHRNRTTNGEFVFMLPVEVEAFLGAADRMVKALRSGREHARILEVAAYVRQVLAGGAGPARAAVVAEGPAPPRVEEPAYPMPKVAAAKPKSLDPDAANLDALLSPDQREAIGRIEAWYRSPGGRHWFALAGAAGSGKTTVTGAVVRRLGLSSHQVMLLAPTGKAVEALKARLPRGWRRRARTLASFLWSWKFKGFRGEDNEFVNGGPKPVEAGLALLVVDEASMVTKRDFEALGHYPRVLFTGDPDQLPPVLEDGAPEEELGSCGVLDRPDATLEAIHRHGKDTSIYVVSHGARQGRQPDFQASPDGRVLFLSEEQGHFGRDHLAHYIDRADVVLTQRNSVRVMINEYVRRRRGFMRTPVDFTPKPGEILVCGENFMHPERRTRVANGERLVVREFLGRRAVRPDVPEIEDFAVIAHPEGREIDEGEWLVSSQMLRGDQIRAAVLTTEHVSGPRSNVLRADWGYALTVHKAQGSEWPRVVVVDDLDPDHRVPLHKWYYVAYSRAVEQLVILKVRRETLLFELPGWGD
jgi:exodeoxyribonuclease-5